MVPLSMGLLFPRISCSRFAHGSSKYVRRSFCRTIERNLSPERMNSISLTDWLQLEVVEFPAKGGGGTVPLLDVRDDPSWWVHIQEPQHESSTGQAETEPQPPLNSLQRSNTTVVWIPSRDLRQRSYELPPRNLPFAVLYDPPIEDASNRVWREILIPHTVNGLEAKRKQQRGWDVKHIIAAEKTEAHRLGISMDKVPDIFPHPKLWAPDSMVEKTLLPILMRDGSSDTWNTSAKNVYDLGAGSGRDVCFLAEKLLHTRFNFIAVDQRYRNMKEEECLKFFARRGLRKNTDAIRLDLRRMDEVNLCLNGETKCLFMVRFWSRSLVESIASSPKLLPGTLFAITHFAKPEKDYKWNFDHPKVRSPQARLCEPFSRPL